MHVRGYIFMRYENLVRVLTNKHLKIIRSQETNDPLEFQIAHSDIIPEEVQNEQIYLDENFGFISFCSDYRSSAMWGHYADSHRGVCIEFEFPVLFEIPSTLPYDGSCYHLNVVNDWIIPNTQPERVLMMILVDVHYSDQRFRLGLDEQLRFNWGGPNASARANQMLERIQPFTTKESSWRFENEKRIIISLQYPNNDLPFDFGTCYRGTGGDRGHYFTKSYNRFIKRIILGPHCRAAVADVQELVNSNPVEEAHHTVHVVSTTYSRDRFEIVIADQNG